MATCATCKHWSQAQYRQEEREDYGYCNNTIVASKIRQTSYLETEKDFGCIFYEEREVSPDLENPDMGG